MTTTTNIPKTERPAPTSKQLAYLRSLARRTGTTFTPPTTRAQASREIQRLKKIASTGFTFAELEAEQAARYSNDDLPLPSSLTSAVHDWEITGYGSTATWSQRS